MHVKVHFIIKLYLVCIELCLNLTQHFDMQIHVSEHIFNVHEDVLSHKSDETNTLFISTEKLMDMITLTQNRCCEAL